MHSLKQAIAVVAILSASVGAKPIIDPQDLGKGNSNSGPEAPSCVKFSATARYGGGTHTLMLNTDATLNIEGWPVCSGLAPDFATYNGASRTLNCSEELASAKMEFRGEVREGADKYEIRYKYKKWGEEMREVVIDNVACESTPMEELESCGSIRMSGSANC